MKHLYSVLTVLLLFVAAFWIASKFLFSFEKREVQILDYKPTIFEPSLSRPHFFELNGSLAYSKQLAIDTPLFEGDILDVLVSPNGLLAAVVTNSELWVVSSDGNLKRKIGDTGGVFGKSLEPGTKYIRNDTIQWTHDSQQLYLLVDERYEPPGRSQLYSNKSELVQYDIGKREFTVLVSPLKSNQYFLYKDLYLFYYSNDLNGNISLFRKSLKQVHHSAESVEASSIDVSNKCDVFYNFSKIGDRVPLQRIEGFFLKRSEPDSDVWIISKHQQALLRIKEGITIKGPWHGVNLTRSSVPKNEKYLLIEVISAMYEGMLLVNTETKSYMEFGKTAYIYQANNTCNTNDWRIANTGIENW